METYIQIAQNWLSNSWRVMVGVKFPGLDLSVAGMVIAVFLAIFSLKVFAFVMGFSFSCNAGSHIYPSGPYLDIKSPARISDGREHSLVRK